jgi:hypothetical protein
MRWLRMAPGATVSLRPMKVLAAPGALAKPSISSASGDSLAISTTAGKCVSSPHSWSNQQPATPPSASIARSTRRVRGGRRAGSRA